MLEFLPMLIGLPILLIWPVWFLRNKRRPTSPLITLLAIPGLLLWLLLILLGVGPASQNLLYEPLGIDMIAVMLAYWKLFKLDRTNPERSGQTVVVLMLLATLAVRLTMPA